MTVSYTIEPTYPGSLWQGILVMAYLHITKRFALDHLRILLRSFTKATNHNDFAAQSFLNPHEQSLQFVSWQRAISIENYDRFVSYSFHQIDAALT